MSVLTDKINSIRGHIKGEPGFQAVVESLEELNRPSNGGYVDVDVSGVIINPPANKGLTVLGTGLIFPVKTTVEKNALAAPVKGQTIIDSTLNKLCFYDGTVWRIITST